MSTRNIILVDLDHTISNAFWRDPMIGTTHWDDYHQASMDDEPLHDLINLVLAWRFYNSNRLAFGITARPGKFRALSNYWLIRRGCLLDELLMRADDNFEPSGPLKLALAIERFGSEQGVRDNVAFIIDDHEQVIQSFRSIGVTALQVFARQK